MSNDMIRVCRPDPNANIYVLGGMSWRVSLHTQQRRAIDLVEAIAKKYPEASQMAVVGGGAGGITCAAALRMAGFKVTLLERAGALLSLQRKNTTRFLHPNSVTWPYSPLPCTTDLPFLNWHSAYSTEVAEMLEHEFRTDFVGRGLDGLAVVLNANVIEITADPNGCKVTFEEGDGPSSATFAAVFIATGFNRERKVSGYDNFSYWEDTSPIPIGSPFALPKVAIVGDGDGALVELVRCAWMGQHLDELYRFVAEKFVPDQSFTQTIIDAEEEARPIYPGEPEKAHEILATAYRSQILTMQGRRFLRAKYSGLGDLTIVSRFAEPFSPRASPLHKVLLAFLLEAKLLAHEPLNVEAVAYRTESYFIAGRRTNGDDAELGPFDRVLERLGPEREYCPLVKATFKSDILENFQKGNAVEFDFANPIATSRYPPERQKVGPLSEEQPIEAALSKLERYFRVSYPNCVMEVAIEKRDAEIGFSVSVNSENLKQDGPKVYSGYSIWYKTAKSPPRALAGADQRFAEMDSDDDEILTAGQVVVRISGSEPRRSARITTFISPEDASDSCEIYFISAAHALGAEGRTKVAVHGREVGHIDNKRFADKVALWKDDSDYWCLKDICIVRVEKDVLVRNASGPDPIRAVTSATDHLLTGDGRVFVKGKYFGQVSRVKANPVFLDPDGNLIRTSGFFVRREDDALEMLQGSSGQPVLSGSGDLLGMIIAASDDELFCADMSEVLDRLECKLVPYVPEGVAQRSYA